MARKMMAASTPVVEISSKDDTWTIKTSTMIRTTELTFKSGEEYEESMPSGDVLKVTYCTNKGKHFSTNESKLTEL